MRVNGSRGTGQRLKTQNGELVPLVTFQVHLGSSVTNDQQSGKELGRRFSTAGATMKKLQDVWKHSTTGWNLRVFNAAEWRLEETGRSPSPMVAADFAHTLCLLQQNH